MCITYQSTTQLLSCHPMVPNTLSGQNRAEVDIRLELGGGCQLRTICMSVWYRTTEQPWSLCWEWRRCHSTSMTSKDHCGWVDGGIRSLPPTMWIPGTKLTVKIGSKHPHRCYILTLHSLNKKTEMKGGRYLFFMLCLWSCYHFIFSPLLGVL